MNKSFALTKKFRYGSVATIFTVMFVAVIIILNVITTALANKYLWYIDMTKEQIFTLSPEAISYIGDLGDQEVNIYFCQEADKIESQTLLKMVYNLALELEKEFSQITVTCLDSLKNYSFFQKFQTTAASTIRTDTVIIESGTEFRLHSLQSFFVQNESGVVWAFNGEAKMAASILSITTSDKPKAYFTADHGEDLQSGSFGALATLLMDSGYDVNVINLAKEELPADARIVIVNSPVYDFMGDDAEEASGNEIDKLDAFLDRFGALLVFADPDNAGNLTNLNEFLEEWGIAFTPQTYVKDLANSVTTDGQSIVTQYTSNTLGASLYTDISKLGGTMPKTIVRYAMPIEILFEQGGGLSGSRDVSAVLLSSPEAQVIANGQVVSEGNQEALMTISRETRIIDNEYYYSYVIACGSSNYSNYLVSNTYANRDILYSAMRATGKDKIPAEFKYKVFETHNLDITTAESNQWTIMLTVALPAVIGVCGLILHVKRKHA